MVYVKYVGLLVFGLLNVECMLEFWLWYVYGYDYLKVNYLDLLVGKYFIEEWLNLKEVSYVDIKYLFLKL